MKKKTIKILMMLFITAMMLLIGNHVSNAAYAWISASNKNVSVGDSVTVRVYGEAKSWSLKSSGPGFSGGTVAGGNLDSDGEGKFDKSYSFDTSKAGTYTLSLTGDVTDAKGSTKDISDTVTIVVSEKSSSSTSNNSNSNTNSNSNSNSSSNTNNSTNEKEPTFTKTNDTVYSTGSVNVRKSYSTESSVIGSLSEGEEVKREATGDNGWSRISYNGGTGYVKTSLLTTEKKEEKSANKALKSLTVKPEGLDPAFDPEVTTYSLSIGSSIDKVEVNAVANDEKAKVDISGNEDIKDKESAIKITVTAEDGTARTYTINVTKQDKKELLLKSVTLKDYNLSPEFKSNVFSYKVSITDPNVTKLDLSAIAEDENNEVTITGNENFKNGQNIVTISIKEKDSQDETIYKIYVNKTAAATTVSSKLKKNEKSKLPLYIGIGLIIVLIIAIIIVYIKGRREDDYYDDDEEYGDNDGKNLYGYSSKDDREFDVNKDDLDKTTVYKTQNTELNKVKEDEEEFDFNPYTKKDVYGDYSEPKRKENIETQNEDLFGTINGVDESYKYTDTPKDDLSEALNNYKEQEKQEINSKLNQNGNQNVNTNNNQNDFSSGVGSFDYNSYLENSYGFDDDERPRRSRGKHSK